MSHVPEVYNIVTRALVCVPTEHDTTASLAPGYAATEPQNFRRSLESTAEPRSNAPFTPPGCAVS